MSDDDALFGRPETERQQGFSPMPSSTPKEPEDEPEIYSSDRDGLLDATEDLIKSRGGEKSQPDTIDRGYQYLRGENAGEPVEPNRTLDIERAASDLAKQRALEVQAIELQENTQLRDAVDSAKGVATESEVADWVAQQQAQQQTQQHQAQAEPPPPGVDAELYELLRSNPKVSAALQAEVAQVTRAQAQFAEASLQNAKMAAAALVADVPELQGLDSSQYGLALEIVSRQNPQKAAEIRQRFGKIEELYRISKQASEQRTQLAYQRDQQVLEAWRNEESAKWDRWAAQPDNQQRLKTVMPQAISVLSEAYGLSRQDVMYLQKTQPLLSSKLGQEILLDAISYRAALRTANSEPGSCATASGPKTRS